jgi:hypothetical protein
MDDDSGVGIVLAHRQDNTEPAIGKFLKELFTQELKGIAKSHSRLFSHKLWFNLEFVIVPFPRHPILCAEDLSFGSVSLIHISGQDVCSAVSQFPKIVGDLFLDPSAQLRITLRPHVLLQ